MKGRGWGGVASYQGDPHFIHFILLNVHLLIVISEYKIVEKRKEMNLIHLRMACIAGFLLLFFIPKARKIGPNNCIISQISQEVCSAVNNKSNKPKTCS